MAGHVKVADPKSKKTVVIGGIQGDVGQDFNVEAEPRPAGEPMSRPITLRRTGISPPPPPVPSGIRPSDPGPGEALVLIGEANIWRHCHDYPKNQGVACSLSFRRD